MTDGFSTKSATKKGKHSKTVHIDSANKTKNGYKWDNKKQLDVNLVTWHTRNPWYHTLLHEDFTKPRTKPAVCVIPAVPLIIHNDVDFVVQCIRAHNSYRSKHGRVGYLVHNEQLSILAQKTASQMIASKSAARQCSHGCGYRDRAYGQNIAFKINIFGKADYSGAEVVNQWYNGSSKYDYEHPEIRSGDPSGSFTQVAWKTTREIGVAKVSSADGRNICVVCNYFPAGNFPGRFADNVFPAK